MSARRVLFLVAAGLLGVAGCGGKSKSNPPPPPPQTFTIGGTVSGLSASGLVLQNNGGDDLTVASGATSFKFATAVASGAAYAVTVKTQPSGEVCTVANGTGTATANVTGVAVTCAAPNQTFKLGGAVSGLTASGLVLSDNLGEDLTVPSGATSYAFVNKAPTGTVYSITVKTQPSALTCTIANATGTVGTADVTNANVACTGAIQRWAAPSTWGGLWPASPTMRQHAHFDGQGIVEDTATGIGWSVVAGNAPPQTELKAFPSGSRFGAGPFSGQIFQANATTDAALDALTGDMLVCAVIKPDFNPTMVGDEHEKPIIARGEGHDTLDVPGGGWVLMQMHSFFCFHYEFLDANNVSHMHMAIIPTSFADHGTPGQGPLNPTYVVFCGGRDGNTIRSAVNAVRAGGNLYSDSVVDLGTGNITLDKGSHRLTIGGYEQDVTDRANHVFGGRVYETAVWSEPATPANIRAKLDAIQGIDAGATYLRNREAWFTGADAALHAAWWDGPRIDPTRGFLFGLQSFNHLGNAVPGTGGNLNAVYAPGEDMGLWTATGATVAAAGDVEPPGDSGVASAKRVTLQPGGSLQTPLAAFDTVGPIHGQLWVRVPTATTEKLQLVTDQPATGGSGTFDIDLTGVAPNIWTRIWLRKGTGNGNELTTNGNAGHFSIVAPGTNTGPLDVYVWGVDLTQIGSLPTANADPGVNVGVDLGAFDPGQLMYDWMGLDTSIPGGATTQYPLDVLQLPPVPASTPTGFCLSVDASTPAGLPWAAPFTRPRTMAAWVNDPLVSPPATTARLYVDGAVHTGPTPNPGELCFQVGAIAPLCAAVPTSFTAGSSHTIKACMSAAGDLSLSADGTALASAAGGAAAPDLNGGTVLVGAALAHPDFESNPWNGYVSKAVVCHFGDTCE